MPQPRADAQRNRDALVAAARRVFAERGTNAPLDLVVKAANVGSATLYRHFPTRRDLLVAAYAEEIEEVCARARRLLSADDAVDGLFEWLAEFITHVSTKRELALAGTAGGEGDRSTLFESWHAAMRQAAGLLLDRARRRGAVAADVRAADLVTLANGIAMASVDEEQRARLLDLMRSGLTLWREYGLHKRQRNDMEARPPTR
ncbi:MAG TPA: helix-turn-helix domain-containing protein [Stackebrandtia sp.]|jgi:AcrR family transcriptional regulator|uniref:TetR/AcrR family transcriptional regulator n=1 Tax=Stackebrandtia sp. TaxID=2023065 RepID=UPI002D245668|nr:helix-turn-helix domain-containing protein [Stackebrandtia sp.]HZE39542.1 helix-turn-helix domain-containing protein [Stackebrandtia sp.]